MGKVLKTMKGSFILLSMVCILLDCWLLSKKENRKSMPENLFLSVSGVVVWLAAAALGLTILGEYSLVHLNLILAVTAALLCLALLFTGMADRRRRKQPGSDAGVGAGRGQEPVGDAALLRKKPDRYHLILFLICLAALLLYVLFPTEYLIGGRDPGVYTIQGAYINQSGGLYIHDNYLSENYERLQDVIRNGYPGFYSAFERGLSRDPGQIIPQFLPMFPSVLAIGFSLAGVDGAVRVNALIAVLSLIAFYAFAKGLIGRKGALLATLLLAINPSQIWNARITQTEILSQFLFFAAMAVFTEGYRRNDRKAAAISGILMGISCFNRIDTYIFGLGIYLCTAYIILVHRGKSRFYLTTSLWYTVGMVLSVLYGFRYSAPYYRDLWVIGSLKMLLLANAAFVLLIPLAFLIRKLIIDRKPDTFRPLFFCSMRLKRRRLPQWFTCVLFALFLFASFIRPLYFTGGFEVGTEEYFRTHSLLEFGFYVPQIAMLFGFLGVYHIIRGKGIHPYLIFIAISAASILIYTYQPSITPDHPWASRRWITVNIPVVLLMAVYGIQKIRFYGRSWNRWIKNAVVFSLFIFSLSQSGLFLFQSMFKGYGAQFEKVARAIPEDTPAFAEDGQLASPLTYINGKKVYLLKEGGFSQPMADFIKEEGSIYGVGWPNYKQVDFMFRNGISLSRVHDEWIRGFYPEQSRGHYPEKVVPRDYDAGVRRLDYSPENLYYTYSLPADFETRNGVPDGGSITSNGQAGFLLFGNYTSLSAGTYELSFSGKLPEAHQGISRDTAASAADSSGMKQGSKAGKPHSEEDADEKTGFIDIVCRQGGQKVSLGNLTDFSNGGKLSGTLSFTLDQEEKDVEFRVYAGEGVSLTVDGMMLKKVR